MAIRRIETKASRTAAYTCFSRACTTREKDPRFQGPDTLAVLNYGTKIFELDAPTTQQPKLEIFRKKRLNIPPELIFTPIDFDREDVFAVLTRAGYQDGQKTLFIWEGVTMYLSAQAVDNTLDFIQNHAAPGSLIIFDYIYTENDGMLHGRINGTRCIVLAAVS